MTGARAVEAPARRAVHFLSMCWLPVVACTPQDIYLSEPGAVPRVELDGGNAGTAGAIDLPGQPKCESAACEECVREGRCATGSATLWCHPISAECLIGCDPDAEAATDAVCPADRRCHPDVRLCVACLDASHCGAAEPACDTRLGQCVECLDDSQTCPSDRSVCLSEERRCVECSTDAHCGAGVCHLEMLRCVGCRTDADCGGEDPRCEPGALVCVECLTDNDCAEPDKPFCSSELECDDD